MLLPCPTALPADAENKRKAAISEHMKIGPKLQFEALFH